jgi:RNA polymerase sigma factor (sigma-70 family)
MLIENTSTGKLLAKNASRLRALVRSRVRSEADADDISQEAQVRALARSRETPLKDPVAYAFRIALNLLSDRGRSGMPASALEEHVPSTDPSPLEALDMKQRAALYARTLRVMPRLRREVFMLRQSAELSYPQIATRLGISIEAAQKHYSRAAIEVRRAVSGEID